MLPSRSLQRVIVVPRNGHANRLKAWASSAILAAEIHSSPEVCWAPEPDAAATADTLFPPHLIARPFISDQTLQAKLGILPSLLPRNLTVDAARGLTLLKGHDLGEQALMPELAHLIADNAVDAELARRRQYSELHIRQTDRSQHTPHRNTVRRRLRALAVFGAPRPLVVAANSPEGRDTWIRESATLGLKPWIRARADLDRSDPRAGVDALVDWRLLPRAEAFVYPRESTFSEEASVAFGYHHRSLPVRASVRRQRVRAGSVLARFAAVYPQRHWGR